MKANLRYYAHHAGRVLDNADPDGLGRVKLRVPGLIDESAWVYPGATVGGGSPQAGLWHVPAVGADVYVFFVGADPNQPRWLGGHWATRDKQPEHPTVVREADPSALADASKGVRCWETDEWVLLLDDRPDRRRVVLTAKTTTPEVGAPNPDAATALVVELDLEQQTVAISAAGGIALRTSGTLDLQGTVIQIGGRAVLQTTRKPI